MSFIYFSFRSKDASFLMVSSRDGFCSKLMFEEGEIGVPYEKPVLNVSSEIAQMKSDAAMSNDNSNEKSEAVTNTKVDKNNMEKSDNAMKVDVQTTVLKKPAPKKQEDNKNNKNKSRRIQFTTIS